MRPEIKVLTDYIDEQPRRVYWNHECMNNHISWLCIKDIMEFLDSHNIVYRVVTFQNSQTVMDIPNDEHRTMVRLSWPIWVANRTDDAMFDNSN